MSTAAECWGCNLDPCRFDSRPRLFPTGGVVMGAAFSRTDGKLGSLPPSPRLLCWIWWWGGCRLAKAMVAELFRDLELGKFEGLTGL